MKRIGLFGGTFDPPHLGHFMVADEVRNALRLDEIWFIPNNEPPHKSKASTNNEQRVHMLKSVIGNTDYFKLNEFELNREGKSYTIDTVNYLTSEYANTQFFFIIGGDMVEYLPNWNNIDDLVEKIQFVGVKRQGFQVKSKYSVLEVDVPLFDISSTEIRERIKKGHAFQYFVPKEVYTYIKEHRLYGYGRGSEDC